MEDDSSVDTAIAEKILEDNIMSMVMRGLVNNVLVKKYTPDSNGYIYLPSTTLEVTLLDTVTDEEFDLPIQVTYRGGSSPYLFNVTEQLASWESKVDQVSENKFTVQLVYNLEWQDIETPMQRAIMSASARDYQMIIQGDPGVDQYLAQREVVYTAKGKASDIHSKRRSFLLGSDWRRFGSQRNGPGTFSRIDRVRKGY